MAEPELENPFNPIPDNVIDMMRQRATLEATSIYDDKEQDPEKAARAVQLGKATGVDPAVINEDQENFEREGTQKLARGIVSSNPYIQQYINAHPINAKVSSDDWGPLDSVSNALTKLGHFEDPNYPGQHGFGTIGTAVAAAKGFKEGWGDTPFGTWAFNAPGSEKVWFASKALYDVIGIPIEFTARAFTGAAYAAYRGGTEMLKQAGFDEQTADRMARDVVGSLEHHVISGQMHTPEIAPELIDKIQAKRLMGYITRGEEPPIGVSPIYDLIKSEEAKQDLASLKDVTKEANASATRERSPELFAEFVRQHTGNAKIAIDASAVRQLYGEKLPELEDGILGWVPGIKDQLPLAEQSGGYIEVPLADWLARVEPEVANQLHDHIRVRSNGMSLEETKFEKEYAASIDAMVEAYHGSGKDFEAFDTQHIGSGQGAQSYGFGHYVAQEEKVARDYAETEKTKQVKAQDFRARERLLKAGGNKERALQEVDDDMASLKKKPEIKVLRTNDTGTAVTEDLDVNGKPVYLTYMKKTGKTHIMGHRTAGDERVFGSREEAIADIAKGNKERLEDLQKVRERIQFGVPEPKGGLYKVRINREPEEFLDWNKPFSEQSPHVQERIRALGPVADNLTGEDIYRQGTGKGADKETSKRLSEAGIAGIKYLDQFSRAREETARLLEMHKADLEKFKNIEVSETTLQGMRDRIAEYEKELANPPTSNFVVFNDKDLQIIARNGKPLASLDPMVDSVRSQGGLHPLFDPEKGNKVTLEKVASEEGKLGETKHSFALKDNTGNQIGNMEVTDRGDKIFVNWLGAGPSIGPKDFSKIIPMAGSLGPRIIRDLIAQLKNQFPQAKELDAFRISGARTGPAKGEAPNQAVHINLEAPDENMLRKVAEELSFLYTREIGPGAKVTEFPTEALTPKELEIKQKVDELLNRIAPQAERKAAHHIELPGGGKVRGLHASTDFYKDLIAWSFNSDDPIGTARHETIHSLRKSGFFTSDEWVTLEDAALRSGWNERFNIDARYDRYNISPEIKIEESIAEAYREWGKGQLQVEGIIQKLFERIKELLAQIREMLGGEVSPERLFQKIEKGEIGSRERIEGGLRALRTSAQEPELPQAGTTRMEDRDIFQKGAAIGMTERQYKRYQELIDKQFKDDLEADLAKAEAREKKRQTQEWKDNTAFMRKEVEEDMMQRPDIAADNFLRKGILYGQRLPGKIPSLYIKELTPEQRKALPEKYQSEQGLSPDDVAGLFGYQSGDALIRDLTNYEASRQASGLGPTDYLRRLVDKTTELRMEEKYGKLSENITQDAKDQVLSQTQLDLIHEEVLALAAKDRKAEISISKDDMTKWLQGEFNKLPVGMVKSDSFLRNANRAAKLAEMSLLKGDFAEAFKAKQAQFNSVFLAKAAQKFEKERKSFDNQAEFMSKREVPSVDQEYTDWVHDILGRVDQTVKRTPRDLAESIAAREQKTLQDFVEYKTLHDMREIPVSDLLLDPNFRKPLESLTVDEFRQVREAIKTLVHNGRDEKKIYKAGEAADLAEVKVKLRDQLMSLPFKGDLTPNEPFNKRSLKGAAKYLLASHLQMEALFNRWDRGDPNGPWRQYVMRGLADAANKEADLERDFARILKTLGEPDSINKKIENNIFLHPGAKEEGVSMPMPMQRKHLLAVMLNMGNESNFDALARGYGLDPARITEWVNRYATKKDWDWVQKMGDVFKEIKIEADKMYRRLSDLAPENIEIKPFTTPHGEYPGWYYPIIYSPDFVGGSKKLMGGNPLELDGYFRATTNQGYTKKRTGYVAPVSLALEDSLTRMKAMIHDIAFREEIINSSKIIYDPTILNTITNHYGKHYRDLMIPYIQDVANSANYNSTAAKVASSWSEYFRQNMIGTLIGFNPGTVMKHGPTAWMNSLTEMGSIRGAGSFLKEFATANAEQAWRNTYGRTIERLYRGAEEQATTDWNFAKEHSAELRRRMRHYDETAGGAYGSITAQRTWREALLHLGAYPVALSDMMSAVPTWLAKYKQLKELGVEEGTAISEADYAVRRAHGSTAITNRAQIARGGPANQWLTSLYGFFSHILNRQYELAWRASDTFTKFSEGKFVEGTKDIPRLSTMLFSYIIFPALVEEWVSGSGDPREGYIMSSSRVLAHGISSSWIWARDFAHAAIHHKDPSVGLFSTFGTTLANTVRDIPKGKDMFSKQNMGKTLEHAITTFGALKGWTNAQEGHIARGVYDMATGQQRPRGYLEHWRLFRTGQAKEKRH